MYAFKQARHYHAGRRKQVRIIVIHDMEAAEGHLTAENVAGYFAGPHAPMASAHLNVDRDSVVQSVKIADTAFHAPGANDDGIGIEHAGYARETREEWLADDCLLNTSAAAAAELCNRLLIPPHHLTASEIKDGRSRGFAGHVEVNAVFHGSSHTDPGPGFPWDVYLDKVAWFIPNAHGRNAA